MYFLQKNGLKWWETEDRTTEHCQTKLAICPYNCYLAPLNFSFLLCKMDIILHTISCTIYSIIEIMNYYCNVLFYYHSCVFFLGFIKICIHPWSMWCRWVLSFVCGEAVKGWEELIWRTGWIACLSGIPPWILSLTRETESSQLRSSVIWVCADMYGQAANPADTRFDILLWTLRSLTRILGWIEGHLSFPWKQFRVSVVRAKFFLTWSRVTSGTQTKTQ